MNYLCFMEHIISGKRIEKSFGALKVLKGIDMQVEPAEVVSIMGASGAGKSTLLQILGTLSTPDAGTLEIDGTDVFSLSGAELSAFRNRKIGFVFQFHHLLPEFNALENVMIPALIAQRPEAEARAEAVRLLSEMGLADRTGHKPSELSGGEQQRVAIARALANNPSVIIADEPTGNLDPDRSLEIMSLLEKINDMGTTILVVTHERELVNRFGKRVVAIESGRLISDAAGGYYRNGR